MTTLLLAHFLAYRPCLWAALGLFSAFAFGPSPARAAVTEAWVHRYNGPANNDDFAKAVAVDGSGNVVVTGTSNGNNSATSLALGPNGMVAITGTSYVTVVYWENLPPVSIELVPTGLRLHFPGVPGRSYTIERAPAVTGPWTIIDSQIAPASGLLEYLDAPLPAGSAFYRTVQP